jgi:drug/metabolite transporter (DMT)-like permease
MFESFKGEFYALFAAFLWVFGALVFEVLGRKNGATTVNFLRLAIALIYLMIFTSITRGKILPFDFDKISWFWLFISGIIGFAIGDFFLFKAFVSIGARISMLIMSLAPPVAALLGWLILDEKLTLFQFLGMIVTLTGISLVVLQRKKGDKAIKLKNLKYPIIGILLAFGGAVGQGAGLVLSKLGMKDQDAFAATEIRVIAGIFGLGLIISFSRNWRKVAQTIRIRKDMVLISTAAFVGSFLGVSLSLLAIKHTNTGVASTLMAIQPILMIPASIIFLKEKVNFVESFGAFIAVGGIVLFFL